MHASPTDAFFMRRALQLAKRGQGSVEPNPLVGCVIVKDGLLVAEGWHQRFGGPHAEIAALHDLQVSAASATAYVSLEPCCHHGKTPPCTQALIDARIERVVIAMADPFPQVAGQGIQQLRDAGLTVDVGVLETEARALNAPFLKLTEQSRPWLIAKWAMTLDGKIATKTGDSKWISNDACRAIVHHIRGRVDAVMVGSGTALSDDPLLDARPAGPRSATRIVVDGSARLPLDSRLMQSAGRHPVMVAHGPQADGAKIQALSEAGCEVLGLPQHDRNERLLSLLAELGNRHMTNVLVEGGSQLLGALFDLQLVDEVHVFISSKIAGGQRITAVAGNGLDRIATAPAIAHPTVELIGDNVYVHGPLRRN